MNRSQVTHGDYGCIVQVLVSHVALKQLLLFPYIYLYI